MATILKHKSCVCMCGALAQIPSLNSYIQRAYSCKCHLLFSSGSTVASVACSTVRPAAARPELVPQDKAPFLHLPPEASRWLLLCQLVLPLKQHQRPGGAAPSYPTSPAAPAHDLAHQYTNASLWDLLKLSNVAPSRRRLQQMNQLNGTFCSWGCSSLAGAHP